MKKTTKISIITISILCLIIGLFTVNSKIKIENKRKDYEVAIKYADVLAISEQNDEPLEDVLIRLKQAGANTLFVKENTLIGDSSSDYNNYKIQGQATYYEGYNLQHIYPQATNIKPASIYIEVLNKSLEEEIYSYFTHKGVKMNLINIEGETFLETQESTYILSSVGIGFNKEDLTKAAALGYKILPQIKSWNTPTQDSISYVVNRLQQLPNLGPICFADPEVVGTDSPDMQQLVQEKGLSFVEFYSEKQKGFSSLAKISSNNRKDYTVTRLHTLSDGEVNIYTQERLVERYMLALRERNINTFLFKLPTKNPIDIEEQVLSDNIQRFNLEANKKGFTLNNQITPYNLKTLSFWSLLLIGISALGVFTLLCERIGLGNKGIYISIFGLICYALLLKVRPILGTQLMALFGAICFSSYATVHAITMKGKGMRHAIQSLFTAVAISAAGALLVIGTISSTEFGIRVDIFRGEKLSFIAPIIIVLFIMMYKSNKFNLDHIKKWIHKPITYGLVAVLGVLAVAMYVYILRSGNAGQELEIEVQFRRLLANTLGIRPRTKEFLIGYPVIMIITHYGYKKQYWPLLVLATTGPISLIDTYTHIHTPIAISFVRSVYGLVIGLVIGMICIYIIDTIQNFINKRRSEAL